LGIFFIRISRKFNYDEDFFKQNKEEFQDSYTNFMEISKIKKDNIEVWMTFPTFYEEIKDKSAMSVV